MNDCQIRGCRKLEWICKDCGRVVASADFPKTLEWISVKEQPAPPFETVHLCVDGKVIVGWNESCQPEEDPAYCSWEQWPETFISGEGVSHWAPLLKAPQ